jgi:predicted Zn-dependent peptidase
VVSTVEPDELARAKAQMRAGLLMGRESMMTRASQQAKQLVSFDTVLDVNEKLEKIEAVTIKDVEAMARRIFRGRPTLAALGPVKNLEDYDSIAKKLAA